MVINLKPEQERRLREIADKSGQSVTEIVDSAIERIIQERSEPAHPEGEMSPEMKSDMLAHIDEVRRMAVTDPKDEDRNVSENHDRYIYRIDW